VDLYSAYHFKKDLYCAEVSFVDIPNLKITKVHIWNFGYVSLRLQRRTYVTVSPLLDFQRWS